jgi:hypothetical protein
MPAPIEVFEAAGAGPQILTQLIQPGKPSRFVETLPGRRDGDVPERPARGTCRLLGPRANSDEGIGLEGEVRPSLV